MSTKPRKDSDAQEQLFFETWNALVRTNVGFAYDQEFVKMTENGSYLRHVLKDRVLSLRARTFSCGVEPLEFIEWHPDRKYRFVLIKSEPHLLRKEHFRSGLSRGVQSAADAGKLTAEYSHIVSSLPGAVRVMQDSESVIQNKKNGGCYALLILGIDMGDVDENVPVEILRRCDDHLDSHCYPAHLPPRPWK